MKILVTGAHGFIGKNLVTELRNIGSYEVFEFTKENDISLLSIYTKNCDFVFHLAGINRPQSDNEFFSGNVDFTFQLLQLLKEHKNKAPILFTSSIQAENGTSYGRSKLEAEKLIFNYAKENCVTAYVYRLPNVFGKWSKPNYNSVVATFCHNIARGLEIQISHPETELTLCYIDDVLEEFICALNGNPSKISNYFIVPQIHTITLSKLAETIQSFKKTRDSLNIPNMENKLVKNLYSTYLSYLPEDNFSYDLKMNCDERGSFTEFLKTKNQGQVSINVSKPGITKGNHWHHTKNEKFLVVSGEGLIRFRKIDSEDIIEYRVSGEKLQVVDIPVGYTHSIVNVGKNDLVTVMWANEHFDPDKPDTYFQEV
ncbi:NAD-dependent epimerase/dehydratase family protein [Ureibacillus endophyticus]|uniref:SDR family oxidoreductase n=1 Tax=Ureibacillus endophyticus TaxID=1978490 RepID=A0A494Z0D7_9BACL|nr:NAD-dependent epimerase/dehydratase family protein [Lysinibacillus endophyticus]RKQ15439.1 SDR family oxidoreductase [Lysinibacillus endophyticus]